MCQSNCEKVYKTKVDIVVWKIGFKYKNYFSTGYESFHIPYNKIITAENYLNKFFRESINNNNDFTGGGFHCFLKEKDAIDLIKIFRYEDDIVKVIIPKKTLVTEGYFEDYKSIVAKSIVIQN